MLTLETLAPYLLRRRLLDPAPLVDGRLHIEDRSRRNRNFKVLPSKGIPLLIKQASADDKERAVQTLRTEARLLRAMVAEPTLAPCRAYLPSLLDYDAKANVLAFELVHPATSLSKYHFNVGKPRVPMDSAHDLGQLVGRIHRAGAAAIRRRRLAFLPREAPSAWSIVDTFLRIPTQEVGPARAAFARQLARRPDLRTRADDMRKRWTEHDELVHGDLRWENVLLTAGRGPHGGLNLRLVDWELASRGDAAWDVSCALGEYLRFWLSGMARSGAPAWPLARVRPAARTLIQAYARSRGLSKAEARQLVARAMDFLPLNLIWMSAEASLGQAELPARVIKGLDLAVEACEDATAARRWLGLGGFA